MGLVLALTWLFGRTGVLQTLETIVTDTEMRLASPPPESQVAIVNIGDEDYWSLFSGTSPLNPPQLERLIADVAKGEPAVIGVDIDTSAPVFANQMMLESWKPHFVWERELREVPSGGTNQVNLEPVDILGSQKNIDPAKNSSGLPLLIDDADKVTRKYRRVIATRVGMLPSFPWAVTKAYLQDSPEELSKFKESAEDRMIRYRGERYGSHQLHFSASKVEALAEKWPAASPIRGKIVLIGGSYLGQDRHDTPIGQLTGVEVMANVIETELSGGGSRAPNGAVLFFLNLFEALVLIWLFHRFRLRWALICSILLLPVMSLVCSKLAYGDMHHALQFAIILLGLLLFELYEHFRSTTIIRVYRDVSGARRS